MSNYADFVAVWQGYKIYDTWGVSDQELALRAADEYKFEQFDLVKKTLGNQGDKISPISVKNFNKEYGELIIPQGNCYYLTGTRRFKINPSPQQEQLEGIDFIMGFELESDKYKEKYPKGYFKYPDLPNIPFQIMCIQGIGCYNKAEREFEEIISKPCEK